ncbi:uncharacterized protein LOC108086487 [Drosophila ficusphila]|uniref:uncharacterized protein LOC108086487 n=1 Tax=Drosophila ficusphila TaxID=30025 RepID=UPI0007E603F6|nr:uncharacterized protein LOC108086487 [Drosophila ficusphila]
MSQTNLAKSDEHCMRCLHCMQVVRCSRYDTSALVRHIELEHPDIFSVASSKIRNVHKLDSEQGSSGDCISKTTGPSEPKKPMDEQFDPLWFDNHCSGDAQGKNDSTAGCCAAAAKKTTDPCSNAKNKTCPDPKEHPGSCLKKQSLPISKVETCTCAEIKQIRKKYYRASVERWRAVDGLILCPACGIKSRPLIKTSAEVNSGCWANCWPFCYFPCLMSSDKQVYLHCGQCKIFLGIYNREKNSVRPNKEFV